MCLSAVFKSNQCEKRNPVHQRFDVRNRDGAVDTSLFFYQNSRKFKLFLQKNAKFSSAGGFASRPHPWPLAAGDFAPRPSSVFGGWGSDPPNKAPIANFWLRA